MPNNTATATGGVLKKGALKHFARCTGNHLCRSLFFNKLADLRFLLKTDSGTGVFQLNVRNF